MQAGELIDASGRRVAARKESFEAEIADANQKDLDMKETKNDTTILFFLQIVVLIFVLIEYCFNLERPEGDFSCQWVYYSAIVMYKPYTVPMWVCLTYCGHYAFADFRSAQEATEAFALNQVKVHPKQRPR